MALAFRAHFSVKIQNKLQMRHLTTALKIPTEDGQIHVVKE